MYKYITMYYYIVMYVKNNNTIIIFFTELDSKAQNLSILSKKYKKEATNLNLKSMYIKLTAAAVFVIILFLYFYVL